MQHDTNNNDTDTRRNVQRKLGRKPALSRVGFIGAKKKSRGINDENNTEDVIRALDVQPSNGFS